MLECKGLNTERLLIYFFDSTVQLRDSGSEITSQYIAAFFRNNFKHPAGIHKHNQIFIPAYICVGMTYY